MKTIAVLVLSVLLYACQSKEGGNGADTFSAQLKQTECDSLCQLKVDAALAKDREDWNEGMESLMKMISKYESPTASDVDTSRIHVTGQAHVHNDDEREMLSNPKNDRKEWITGYLELRDLRKGDHKILRRVPFISMKKDFADMDHVSFDYAKIPIPGPDGKVLRFVVVAVNLRKEKPYAGHEKNH